MVARACVQGGGRAGSTGYREGDALGVLGGSGGLPDMTVEDLLRLVLSLQPHERTVDAVEKVRGREGAWGGRGEVRVVSRDRTVRTPWKARARVVRTRLALGGPVGRRCKENCCGKPRTLATVHGLSGGGVRSHMWLQGLHCLDSSAMAALLKELSKQGQVKRAFELFDWLRQLPPTHPLASLCDLYTYTTMIAQCGSAQQLGRALELVSEMRARSISCNVHTYSALMNVCMKVRGGQCRAHGSVGGRSQRAGAGPGGMVWLCGLALALLAAQPPALAHDWLVQYTRASAWVRVLGRAWGSSPFSPQANDLDVLKQQCSAFPSAPLCCYARPCRPTSWTWRSTCSSRCRRRAWCPTW